jgi:hypothetical protein
MSIFWTLFRAFVLKQLIGISLQPTRFKALTNLLVTRFCFRAIVPPVEEAPMENYEDELLKDMDDHEMLEGFCDLMAEIAADIAEYKTIASRTPDDCDGLLLAGFLVFRNLPTMDEYRNEALVRGLDLPEWPNEQDARSIADRALVMATEKEREDDDQFLKDLRISGGLDPD